MRSSRCPGFVFDVANTRSSHPKRLGSMMPHICCYSTTSLNIVEKSDIDSRADLGYAEMFFEVLRKTTMGKVR